MKNPFGNLFGNPFENSFENSFGELFGNLFRNLFGNLFGDLICAHPHILVHFGVVIFFFQEHSLDPHPEKFWYSPRTIESGLKV